MTTRDLLIAFGPLLAFSAFLALILIIREAHASRHGD